MCTEMKRSKNSPSYFIVDHCTAITPIFKNENSTKENTPVSNKRKKLNSYITPKSPLLKNFSNLNTSCRVESPLFCIKNKCNYNMVESKSNKKTNLEKNLDENEINSNENFFKVAVRVRPFNEKESKTDYLKNLVCVNSDLNIIKVKDKNDPTINIEFSFDHCFNSVNSFDSNYSDQGQIYNTIAKPLFNKIFNGFNICVFAYGQTGSGKSYTMMGNNSNNGIIPRFTKELFNLTKNNDKKYVIEASYYEIYNEKIYDLLVDHKNDEKVILRIREHPIQGPYVENLTTQIINSIDNLFLILIKGNKNRATAETLMNDRSSRSHAIFTLNLTEQKYLLDNKNTNKKKTISNLSKINFVDLAGSERASILKSTGDRLKEGNLINKSLLTLGKVINQLSERDSFISYRESSLTYLLKECLGGNSLTYMIANISPNYENLDETLSTLRYASKARNIVNKVQKNLIENEKDVLLEEKSKIYNFIMSDLEEIKNIVKSSTSSKNQFLNTVKDLFKDILNSDSF